VFNQKGRQEDDRTPVRQRRDFSMPISIGDGPALAVNRKNRIAISGNKVLTD